MLWVSRVKIDSNSSHSLMINSMWIKYYYLNLYQNFFFSFRFFDVYSLDKFGPIVYKLILKKKITNYNMHNINKKFLNP